MKLPGETGRSSPDAAFTPRQKDNLAAWMVARSDGEHYGRLRTFQFPTTNGDLRPEADRGADHQDKIIAPQITLWNQQGRK